MLYWNKDKGAACRLRRFFEKRMKMERLDKLLSAMGVCARRETAAMAKRGEIRVDGEVCRDPARKFAEGTAAEVRGEKLILKSRFYYMMNKPEGVLSSTEKRGDRTVVDLLPPRQQAQGLFPAGRLDRDSVGLLLLTNDGDLAHKLLSPKRHVDKIYQIRYKGTLDNHAPERFAAGLEIDGGELCLPAKLELTDGDKALVTLHEGKFHQVKRMIAAVGGEVYSLRRVAFGPLRLDETLEPGAFRELTREELEALINAPSGGSEKL